MSLLVTTHPPTSARFESNGDKNLRTAQKAKYKDTKTKPVEDEKKEPD